MRKYYIAWNSTALVAATAKTMVGLVIPANLEVEIGELVLTFDATTAGNVKVEFGTGISGGTSTAATPANYHDPGSALASQLTSATVAYTVEPAGFAAGTLGTTLQPGLFVPLPSYFPFQWPLYEGLVPAESVTFAMRLTASINCNTMGWIAWKE